MLVDLDALEFNLAKLAAFVAARGIRLRAHAKTHKSADIAALQMSIGGACGICCQKVSEAEAFVDAGIRDILISNEVTQHRIIQRLARLAKRARILVCVDNAEIIGELSSATSAIGATVECLVEIDVGAGRCGVAPGNEALLLAQRIDASPGLQFSGLQAYHGSAQHVADYSSRKSQIEAAIRATAQTIESLMAQGLHCAIVGGAGTGTFEFEGSSGVYNELQCGSYIFMDASYQKILDASGVPISTFKNSLFVLTGIVSKAKSNRAICDAGLKALSVDSGFPTIIANPDLEYIKCSDEHGVVHDPNNRLRINDRLLLVPGHCDPTVNLYDRLITFRGNQIEHVWPVTARGKLV